MNHLDFPFEMKSVAEDGTFSGYGSIFNVVDRGSDIVRPGAFTEIIKNADGRVVVLWQHDTRQPIATASVKQDDVGLFFDGKLVLEDPQARTAQAHMKAKSVRGVSIGYDTLESNWLSNGVRELTSVRLYELSLVTFPMLPDAQVQTVKSFAACNDQRELKNMLRELHGLSRSKASAGAEALWPILRGAKDDDRDEPPAIVPAQIRALADQIKSITSLITA